MPERQPPSHVYGMDILTGILEVAWHLRWVIAAVFTLMVVAALIDVTTEGP